MFVILVVFLFHQLSKEIDIEFQFSNENHVFK